jgi:hypothetical protein
VVRGATDWARTTPATRGPHASSALTQRNAVSGPRQRARERSIICSPAYYYQRSGGRTGFHIRRPDRRTATTEPCPDPSIKKNKFKSYMSRVNELIIKGIPSFPFAQKKRREAATTIHAIRRMPPASLQCVWLHRIICCTVLCTRLTALCVIN